MLNLETPALLFSATSLILLAYTNRFLAIAAIIRNLKKAYDDEESQRLLLQIKNLNLRLALIKLMQFMGVMSLFFSVFSMMLLYFEWTQSGFICFGISLFLLLVSLVLSAWEISISVNALKLHLSDIKELNQPGLNPIKALKRRSSSSSSED